MSSLDVSGRVVVITGASRGLGAGMAERMASQGMKLGLCARTRPSLDGDVLSESVDVRSAEQVEAFAARVVERFGCIDLWINNAGVLEPVKFVRDLTGDQLMAHLDVNVAGVLHGTRAFVDQIRQSERKGVLVNISSGAALKGYAGWAAYCIGKAAVDRLTECVQLEESPSGLRAYSVAPGVINTDMQRAIRSMTPEQFPAVEKFHELARTDAFNSPSFVADCLITLAFGPDAGGNVVVRLPPENPPPP